MNQFPCATGTPRTAGYLTAKRLPELTDRDSRLSIQIQHVAIRCWHATITATPGHADHMIPMVDLGVFGSRKRQRLPPTWS